jgi:hypothetical protein
MTGEPGVSEPTTQLPSQRRPASSDCLIGRDRGLRCLPVIPGTPWCAKHHPERAGQRSAQGREAALTRTRPPSGFGPEWEDPDFKTTEARIAFREAVAGARGRKQLDDKASATLLAACDGAMKDEHAARPAKGDAPQAPLIVEIQKFGPNGVEAPE